MIKFGSKIFIYCLIALSFSSKSIAANKAVDSSIIEDIEKTLLFDKESISKLKFYQGRKNSKVTIDGANYTPDKNDGAQNESQINIIVIEEGSDSLNIRTKEKLAYNTALIGQYEAAIALYKQVIKVEPHNHNAKFALAVIYQKLNQLEMAKKIYQDLLKSDFDDQEKIISNLLAIMIEESPKGAVYFLSRLALQHPDSSYIQAQLGLASAKMKDYQSAITLFEKALSMSPDNINYRYNLAVIYDNLLENDKALANYQEVLNNYSNQSQISIDQVKSRITALKNNS